jgi:hypothetical protein
MQDTLKTQILTRYTDHKHSIRYNETEKNPENLITSIYVNRNSGLAEGKRIRVTIEVLD